MAGIYLGRKGGNQKSPTKVRKKNSNQINISFLSVTVSLLKDKTNKTPISLK